MKRAFPQKVKLVSCQPDVNSSEAGQPKQVNVGVNRRTRTSAAMIGLALSMGASSLLLPHKDDGAVAAEPMTAESVIADPLAAKSASRVPIAKVGSSSIESSSSFVEHVVRPGETLWQISRQYRVPVRAIAAANGDESISLIRVGQVIRVPASRRIAQREAALEVARSSALSVRANEVKAERDESRAQLQQQRERLKRVLATLPSRSVDSVVLPQVLSVSAEPMPSPVRDVEKSTSQEVSKLDEKVPSSLVHQVKPGETLGQIALEYGTSQGELISLNQLSDPDEIRASQSLVVPFGTLPSAEQVPVVPTVPSVEGAIAVSQPETLESQSALAYQVQLGDTISEIAHAHGVTRSELVAVNRLADPDVISAGQLLKLPDNKNEAASTVVPPVVVASASPQVPVVPALSDAVEPSDSVTLPSASTEQKSDAPALPSVLPDSNATITAFSPEFTSTEAAPAVEVAPTVSLATTRESGSVGDPYVQNLLSEVLVMRDRYIAERGSASASSDAPAVVAASSLTSLSVVPSVSDASRINPEFSPERAAVDSDTLQSPGFEAQQAPEAETEAVGGAEPQVVAVAPLGSENYAPLLRPIEGQVVSPELPPLPGAEAYLPNSSAAFAGYMWPARGVLTSGYGWRWGRMHRGIDIGAPTGTPVFAAAPGVVQFSGWNSGGYGNMVEIRHPDGSMTRYAHHSRNLVRAGQQINQGDQIAEVGSTGYSTGPHLHFEVHLPSQGTVNPIAYLPRR